MRTLAVDPGARRVGLALSDDGGKFATPLDVLVVSSQENAIEQILPILEREGVKRIVVGLPIHMDGTIAANTRRTIEWGRQLQQRAGVTTIFVDERLSSFEADQVLQARRRAGEKLTRQRKKEQLDAIAAARFLQDFLDGRLTAIDAP